MNGKGLRSRLGWLAWVVAGLASAMEAAEAPDIRSVAPDQEIPDLSEGPARAGARVKETLEGYPAGHVYHVIFLPPEWEPGVPRKWPVIVEFAGNGNYKNKYGDISTGVPDGSKLGYGITGGRGAIWVCVPFLNAAADDIAINWWGDKPDYNPEPTVTYCKKAVEYVCEKYGGDPDRVVLAGFSRGAIACNFIGLHDDEIAKLWCGFVAYSHYDGVQAHWPYPGADRESALERLKRLKGRPQFICHETAMAPPGTSLTHTRNYLEETGVQGRFTFVETGFANHNDAWVLRPSEARGRLIEWWRWVTAAD